MANIFVRSGSGAGAQDGTSFDDGYLTVLACITAGVTNADTIWIANDHAEVFTVDVTWTFPTSPGLRVLCADTNTGSSPTGLSVRQATVTTSTNGADLFINGYAYLYGLQFNIGSGGAQCMLAFGNTNTIHHGLVVEKCGVDFAASSGIGYLHLGPSGTNIAYRAQVKVIDLEYHHASATVQTTNSGIVIRNGNIHIKGLTVLAGSTVSASGGFFSKTQTTGRSSGHCLIENFDLSGLASTSSIICVTGSSEADTLIVLRNGKITASAPILNGSIGGPGLVVKLHNVDSGDTRIRYAEHTWQGSVVSQTGTLVRTGGAVHADGTTHSILMNGSADSSFYWPLESIEFSKYINSSSVGSPVTVDIEILRDSVTDLTDADIWPEINYYGVSGFSIGSLSSGRIATILTTGTAWPSSSETWDTTGMTNPRKQTISVTFTPQEEGYISGKVFLAANTSVYVCPKILNADKVNLLPGYGLYGTEAAGGGGITAAGMFPSF